MSVSFALEEVNGFFSKETTHGPPAESQHDQSAIHDLTTSIEYPTADRQRIGLAPRTLHFVREGLQSVVETTRGTAFGYVHLPDVPIAGKTGMAQTGTTRPACLDRPKNLIALRGGAREPRTPWRGLRPQLKPTSAPGIQFIRCLHSFAVDSFELKKQRQRIEDSRVPLIAIRDGKEFFSLQQDLHRL